MAVFLLLGQYPEVTTMDVENVVERIRAEFEEMPGLVLTMPQASRFFGIDQDLTRSVMDRLVSSAYLRWTRSGAVARTGSANIPD